jgi:hypothetical protein
MLFVPTSGVHFKRAVIIIQPTFILWLLDRVIALPDKTPQA